MWKVPELFMPLCIGMCSFFQPFLQDGLLKVLSWLIVKVVMISALPWAELAMSVALLHKLQSSIFLKYCHYLYPPALPSCLNNLRASYFIAFEFYIST